MCEHDVPGVGKNANEILAAGCWAEHEDGSLIYVKGTEGGRIIYDIFDLSSDPATYFTDAMPETQFKDFYSWDSTKTGSIKWTWHDKTPFPWDKVIKNVKKPTPQFVNIDDYVSAAKKVFDSLRKMGRDVNVKQSNLGHMADRPASRGRAVVDILSEALNKLGNILDDTLPPS